MKNALNRNVPTGYRPFVSSSDYKNHERKLISEKSINNKIVYAKDLSEVFDKLNIKDGYTLSFHHHLRNGDYVLNMVCEEIEKRNIKNLHLAPSAIFPSNEILSSLIENENVVEIDTNYLNGPVSKTIGEGKLKGMLVMNTHGGRPRKIESGELKIDVAFIATPAVDKDGNGYGGIGNAACGSLGYAIADLKYAKKVVLVTDTVVDTLPKIELDKKYVDVILKVDSIGDPKGIVSGTTKITKDPVGLKIASLTAKLLDELGMIKDGVSMQTGAGGTSLAVASYVKDIMIKKNVVGSFASGGITGYFVDMQKNGLLERLNDVQCFDIDAVESYNSNPHHFGMSGSKYANPYDDPVVDYLDFVILGATEIDKDFNVNVTTDSYGKIMGGSGGHSDTAHGAKVSIITTNLIKSRMPIIKDHVTTITTPGEDIDVLVTERGIAINPKRTDLINALKDSRLPIYDIEYLYNLAHKITGTPKKLSRKEEVIGLVEYRDGTIIDSLYKY
ncbi:MAG: citrate lyase subunit alpha [Bacilli bacterium]|nr:citrate lyase subunit alpha [Bacilli bacterium]